jgi:DNA-binding CsgD family transcriptional regulator
MTCGWFVGRDAELALMRQLVADLAAGAGGVVLVEGEQGIGKSALLRAGLARASIAGCQLISAAADELGHDLPLGLMTECLSEVGLPIRTTKAGGISPVLVAADPVLASIEGLLEFVDRLCRDGPVVMVTEDLHWADDASLQLWRRLIRAGDQLPLLLAGSCRPGLSREELRQARRELLARGGTVLHLGPLRAAEVADLVARAVGGAPGPRLTQLVDRAGGNPLYVSELTDALILDGQVLVTNGVADLACEPAMPVPDALAGVIAGRLRLLGEDALRVLRWAALLGSESSAADLRAVAGPGGGDLEQGLSTTVAAGVISVAGPRLAFRHGLIRQVVLDGMPVSARLALHLKMARALADAGSAVERVAAQLVMVPEIAQGWVRDWLTEAGPSLIYQAPRLAADLLGRVLAEHDDADPQLQVLETFLIAVAFLLGRDEEVQQAGRRALARPADPDRAAQISWFMAYALLRAGRAQEGAAVVTAAVCRPGVGEVQLARLQGVHAVILAALGRPDEAARTGTVALEGAERVGDRLGAGLALHAHSSICHLRADHRGRLVYIDRALSVIGDAPHVTDLRLLLLANRPAALAQVGRAAEALAAAEDAVILAERLRYPTRLVRGALAALCFTAGRWDDALAELELILDLPGPQYHQLQVHGYLSLIAVQRDQQVRAQQYLSAVPDMTAWDLPCWANAAEVLKARALCAERAGRAGEAGPLLMSILDPARKDLICGALGFVLPTLTRIALADGDSAAAHAAAAAAALARQADVDNLPASSAVARHCEGLVAAAPALVRAAARYYEIMGDVYNRAEALADASVLLAANGETEAARGAFGEALTFFEAVGATWDIRRTATRLRRHGVRRGHRPSPRSRARTGWEALTPTEVEVAYLIASELSNPDIAADLLVSYTTVRTHISHILAKLGARSRGAIVSEALRHLPASQRVPVR